MDGLVGMLTRRWPTDIRPQPSEADRLLSSPSSAGSGETPTLDTIDSYMKKLHGIILADPQQHEGLISAVREVVSHLER